MTPSREASWTLKAQRPYKSPEQQALQRPRIHRIAKLMALAIKLDVQVRQGVFRDYAEIARLGHVTRARLTQIMNLLNLAPDIQQDLLYTMHSAVTERHLRLIASEVMWDRQRCGWTALKHGMLRHLNQ